MILPIRAKHLLPGVTVMHDGVWTNLTDIWKSEHEVYGEFIYNAGTDDEPVIDVDWTVHWPPELLVMVKCPEKVIAMMEHAHVTQHEERNLYEGPKHIEHLKQTMHLEDRQCRFFQRGENYWSAAIDTCTQDLILYNGIYWFMSDTLFAGIFPSREAADDFILKGTQ